MTFEMPVQVVPVEASGDLSGNQFYIMKVDSNGQLAVAGASDSLSGILQDKPSAQGRAGGLLTFGVSNLIVGAAVSPGNRLTADADGKAVAANVGDSVIGIALEEGGQANEVIGALIFPAGAYSYGVETIEIPITFTELADGDIVTDLPLDFAGEIVSMQVITTVPTTDADADCDLHLEIDAQALTGGVASLSDANVATLGAVVEASAITGNETFNSTNTLSVVAANTTAFSDGEGVMVIQIKATGM